MKTPPQNGSHTRPEIRLSSRSQRSENTIVKCGSLEIGAGKPVIIAGPCAVESKDQILEIAGIVKSHGADMLRGGAFKPRSSPYSFQGLGKSGLEYLAEARKLHGLPVVTEILDAGDVALVAEYADILQVGSRNMHNFRLLKAVGEIKKPVLLKRGMAATIDEFLLSAEYILSSGNPNVVLCERGIRTFSDYSRNTLDLNVVPAIKQASHLPIIVDPSHGTGRRDLVSSMSLAAIAAGADGIMVEVHTHPEASVSDAAQTIDPEQFGSLMHRVHHFSEWQEEYEKTLPGVK